MQGKRYFGSGLYPLKLGRGLGRLSTLECLLLLFLPHFFGTNFWCDGDWLVGTLKLRSSFDAPYPGYSYIYEPQLCTAGGSQSDGIREGFRH